MVRIRTLTPDTQLHVGAMLPLIAIIGGDITTGKTFRIYYKTPTGTTGYWTAEIQDAANGYIKYDTAVDDLSVAGIWTFWGWETDVNDNVNNGKAVKREVYEIGNIAIN